MDKTWQHEFKFTQSDVDVFAQVTGDTNPIHLDEEYASTSVFGRRVIHGALSNSIFSKVFGTINPGLGTIYLSQNSSFKAPMYTDTDYIAYFEEIERKETGIVFVKTEIRDKNTNKITISGDAVLKVKI